MSNFQVTKNKNPVRCSICHQTDLYDPFTDRCRRCDKYSSLAAKKNPESLLEPTQPSTVASYVETTTLILLWVGWVPIGVAFHSFMGKYFPVGKPGLYYMGLLFFYVFLICGYLPRVMGNLAKKVEKYFKPRTSPSKN